MSTDAKVMRPKTQKAIVRGDDGKESEVELICMLDGLPVYEYEDGAVKGFNVPEARQKVKELADERETLKADLKTAQEALAAYTGLDGKPVAPDAVRAALQKMADLAGKRMIDVGEAEQLREALKKEWEERVAEASRSSADALAKAKDTIRKLSVGNLFATCPFFAGGFQDGKKIEPKVFGDPQGWDRMIGHHFAVDDEGHVTAYYDPDTRKKQVWKRDSPGTPAQFEEAAELIIATLPGKEAWLRGTAATGTGSPSGTQTTTGAPVQASGTPEDLINAGLSQLGIG